MYVMYVLGHELVTLIIIDNQLLERSPNQIADSGRIVAEFEKYLSQSDKIKVKGHPVMHRK